MCYLVVRSYDIDFCNAVILVDRAQKIIIYHISLIKYGGNFPGQDKHIFIRSIFYILLNILYVNRYKFLCISVAQIVLDLP